MAQSKYKPSYHPKFFDTLDLVTKDMTDDEFSLFYELFKHEVNNLCKNPYEISRECKYGVLKEEGFRTMTFHSKLPKIGTGDLRIIFKVDEGDRINLFFAVGKRINDRPRPANDIYSLAEETLRIERES